MPAPGPRVALLCATAPPAVCGIGDYTARLADALRGQGTTADVWTRDTLAGGGPWDAAALRVLARRLRDERSVMLHVQYETALYDHRPSFALGVARAARRVGVPLVTTLHSLDGPPSWGRAHRAALLPLLLASADVTVCSGRQFRALSRLPRRLSAKVQLIPVGSNVPAPAALPDRTDRGAPLRLVYFGFVWRGKRLETAVRSLAAVVAEIGPATLTVVGAVRDPAYRDEVCALGAALGVADRLTFTGELPTADISCALSRADIALLPYPTGASTGHGTLAAALAHGLPVVTTDLPANRSPLFADGDNLLLAPVDDEGVFVRQTVRLAAAPALRARVSAGALRLAEHFAWPRIAAQVLNLPSYRRAFGSIAA
jgi:glycosyltransferase involved in cell wall biosynthesis